MIALSRPGVPQKLARDGAAETQGLIDAHARGEEVAPKSSLYGHAAVKSALVAMHHGKCAYCEVQLAQQHGDVEHYRPKKAWKSSRGGPVTTPGYFWLAYEWDNLLLACEVCNQSFKGNLFPLEDEATRADHVMRDTSGEVPLLIDPSAVDPGDHFEFDQWDIAPKHGSPKGQVTIEVCGLDSQSLGELRRDHFENVRRVLNLTHTARPGSSERAEGIAFLQEALSDGGRFAAMIRDNFGDEIAALAP